jgi:ABC-type lipoprotein export system ATPase subunit
MRASPPAECDVILQAENITKTYQFGKELPLDVLKGVSLSVRRGERVAIIGSSGSGKSTLLHVLGALDEPTSGRVICDSHDLTAMSSGQRDRWRCLFFGFVFQFYHLLPDLNVVENVLFPQMIRYSTWSWLTRARTARAQCVALLEQVGLGHRLKHRPHQLSGGERQRVAVARALANQPAVLLADEPTGNLDKKTGLEVLRVFQQLHERGQTIVVVTHDPDVAAAADRVLKLEDGTLRPA